LDCRSDAEEERLSLKGEGCHRSLRKGQVRQEVQKATGKGPLLEGGAAAEGLLERAAAASAVRGGLDLFVRAQPAWRAVVAVRGKAGRADTCGHHKLFKSEDQNFLRGASWLAKEDKPKIRPESASGEGTD